METHQTLFAVSKLRPRSQVKDFLKNHVPRPLESNLSHRCDANYDLHAWSWEFGCSVVSATKLQRRDACDVEEARVTLGNSPFGPAGGLDHRGHAVSVQALGLGEVDHIEDDSLREEAEERQRKKSV